MKATEFTLEVLKNIGNYENVKFSVTYKLDKNEEPNFAVAKKEIEQQFAVLYCKKEQPKQRRIMSVEEKHKIEFRLANGTATIAQVLEYYSVDDYTLAQWKEKYNTNH